MKLQDFHIYRFGIDSTRFSLSVENEQAGAGRDGRTRLARPNYQARTGTEKYYFHFPCSADHEQDWHHYPVDPYSAICDDHTYYLVPSPSETWFRGMSVGGSFRRE